MSSLGIGGYVHGARNLRHAVRSDVDRDRRELDVVAGDAHVTRSEETAAPQAHRVDRFEAVVSDVERYRRGATRTDVWHPRRHGCGRSDSRVIRLMRLDDLTPDWLASHY